MWESRVKTLDEQPMDSPFGLVASRRYKFFVGGLELEPKGQYVLFISCSKDFEETDPSAASSWAVVFYPRSPTRRLVYQLNGGDESMWTAQRWESRPDTAMAMKVWLK